MHICCQGDCDYRWLCKDHKDMHAMNHHGQGVVGAIKFISKRVKKEKCESFWMQQSGNEKRN